MIRELILALKAVPSPLSSVRSPTRRLSGEWPSCCFPRRRGSLIYGADGRTVIGSELIAQKFESDRYFHPRPSAVDFKADAAGGSNLGTNNPDLHKAIADRVVRSRRHREQPAPVDLVTASGSGLDPDISPEAALFQAPVSPRPEACRSKGSRPDRSRDESIGSVPRRPAASERTALEPGARQATGSDRDLSSRREPGNHLPCPRAELHRPTPEQFLNLIRRQTRGRLKVYLGSAAGVGKTYAMLREGNRLKAQGVDVVIGLVETHGRAETEEQIGDLEIIPPRVVEYRGVTLREMDVDAILARRPTICLVDELAHTNAPGSRHPKRYQDVEDLLHAGIHVIRP